LELSLITGRSIDQGCGKEHGKLSEEYMKSVAICQMNPEDMKKLQIREGENVKVTTRFGSVVVKAQKSRSIRSPRVIFIPYGPWASHISPPDTGGTGMPILKGIPATVEVTTEKVLDPLDLLVHSYGKEKSSIRD